MLALLSACGGDAAPPTTPEPTEPSTGDVVPVEAPPAPVFTPGSPCELHDVPGTSWNRLAFTGSLQGSVRVDERGTAAPQLVVEVAGLRPLALDRPLGEAFELARPTGVACIAGEDTSFVVYVASEAGDDCAVSEISALVVSYQGERLHVLAEGVIGYERNGFGTCVDTLTSTMRRDGSGYVVESRLERRGPVPEPSISSAARSYYRRATAEVTAQRTRDLRAATRRHASAAEIAEIDEAADDMLGALLVDNAFEIERPYLICGFPGVSTTCTGHRSSKVRVLGHPVDPAEQP